MTVKELISLLQAIDEPDRVVIMAKGAEGNSHSPLFCMSTCAFRYEDNEVGLEELTDGDRAVGYTEEDLLEGGVPALVFHPIE